MTDYPDHIEKEMGKARAEMNEAMGAESDLNASMDAGMRAALDYALKGIRRDLPGLEKALGHQIDPGAFLMGALAFTFAFQGLDTNKIVARDRERIIEYMEKARARES